MRLIPICIILSGAFAQSALAHPSAGAVVSFATGIVHPFSGIDHLAVMTAVGLWSAIKGGRALWIWPTTFVAVMLVGGALGLSHIRLPFVEPGILASVVVLGLMVASAVDLPVSAGAAIIGVFALLHGHAHGVEAADNVNGMQYMVGFALATFMLHALGIGSALTLQRAAWGVVNRVAGGICVAVGVGLSAGVL